MSVSRNPLWDEDPSPSFDQMAEWAGVEDLPVTSPQEPSMSIDWQIQVFWPAVPYCAEETR